MKEKCEKGGWEGVGYLLSKLRKRYDNSENKLANYNTTYYI